MKVWGKVNSLTQMTDQQSLKWPDILGRTNVIFFQMKSIYIRPDLHVDRKKLTLEKVH